MASIPQYPYYDHYISCTDLFEFQTPFAGTAMWVDQVLPFSDNGAFDMVPPEPHDLITTSTFSMTSLPEQLGVSDMAVPVLPEFDSRTRDVAGISWSSFESAGGYRPDLGEQCNGFVSDYRSAYLCSNDNWGFQPSQVPTMEEPGLKVGKYTVEERKDRILRYLKKRNQRNFNKTIKYACRKTLADKRIRVRGRFARNNELCQGEAAMKKNNTNNISQEDSEFYNNIESIKMEHDGDDWLQETMASLMYLPYISG